MSPTFAELTGKPDLEIAVWYGLFAPAGTSPVIVSRLARELQKAAETPAVRARLEANGGVISIGNAKDLGELVLADNLRFRNTLKDLGLLTGR